MWVENMGNIGKRARMQHFGRRTSKDDTPGQITGGLPKMHISELSARYRLDWTGSQYFERILMNFTIPYRQKFFLIRAIPLCCNI